MTYFDPHTSTTTAVHHPPASPSKEAGRADHEQFPISQFLIFYSYASLSKLSMSLARLLLGRRSRRRFRARRRSLHVQVRLPASLPTLTSPPPAQTSRPSTPPARAQPILVLTYNFSVALLASERPQYISYPTCSVTPSADHDCPTVPLGHSKNACPCKTTHSLSALPLFALKHSSQRCFPLRMPRLLSLLSGHCRYRRQQLNLSDQEAFFVRELVIVCPIVQERRQEPEQPVPVVDQDLLHGQRLVRICNKHLSPQLALVHSQNSLPQSHLEYMKALVVDHAPVVAKQLHNDLQIVS